jgi:hypothetical protein
MDWAIDFDLAFQPNRFLSPYHQVVPLAKIV